MLHFLADSSILITLNGQIHGIIGIIPHAIVQDPYAVESEEHWLFHKKKLEQLLSHKTIKLMTSAKFTQAFQNHQNNYIDSLLNIGQVLRQHGTALLRLKLMTAIKTTIKLKQGNNKYSSLVKKRVEKLKNNPNNEIEIPISVEFKGFQRIEQFKKGVLRKNKAKIWTLLITIALFILAFLPLFDKQSLLIIIGVLFFHEIGHFGAMRLFGYKNTSIFFLPFFGAAAAGRKDDATISKKFVVLLGGPLPGVIADIIMAFILQGKVARNS